MCIFHSSRFFTVSHHIPVPTVCVSQFERFSVFLTILQVIPCELLIFLFGQFLAIFQVLKCAIFIFLVFQCVLPYSRSYNIRVLFSIFFSFLAKIQVPDRVFLPIFQFLQCVFLVLHGFQCFSPFFMTYHVSFSFSSLVSFLVIF